MRASEREETAVVDAAALVLVLPSATAEMWTAARSCGRSVWGHWVGGYAGYRYPSGDGSDGGDASDEPTEGE